MTHLSIEPHVKPPEIASHDRDVGAALAFVVFVVTIVALALVLRRVRARALSDRADRELRDAIDATQEGR